MKWLQKFKKKRKKDRQKRSTRFAAAVARGWTVEHFTAASLPEELPHSLFIQWQCDSYWENFGSISSNKKKIIRYKPHRLWTYCIYYIASASFRLHNDKVIDLAAGNFKLETKEPIVIAAA
jgi:hypothetical protein